MDFKDHYKDSLESRMKGSETLSWIERLGVDFADGKYNLPKGGNQSGFEFLVFRINEDGNRICAYQCYLNTSGDHHRFCINFYKEGIDGNKLRSLMEKFHSEEKSTRNWWKEVFSLDSKGYFAVDDDILKKQNVMSNNGSDVTINELLSEISGVIDEWGVRASRNTTAIFIDGHYSDCLPLQYAFSKKSNSCKVETLRINVKEFYNNTLKMSDVSTYFNIPKELRLLKLNICEVVSLESAVGEGRMLYTIPMDEGLFNSDIIQSVDDLKWMDLVECDKEDYNVGDLSFKRATLSFFIDGGQGVYLSGDKGVARVFYNTKQQKVNSYKYCLEPTIVTKTDKKKSIASDKNKEKVDNSDEIKLIELNGEIQKALDTTINELRKYAEEFVEKHYKGCSLIDKLYEWINIKEGDKYIYARIRSNWIGEDKNNKKKELIKKEELDWGDYYVFIDQNFTQLKIEWGKSQTVTSIKNNISYIKDLRDPSSHSNRKEIGKLKPVNLIVVTAKMIEILQAIGKNDKINYLLQLSERIQNLMNTDN